MLLMIKQWLVVLYQDEEGASGIEYALIAAMVAVVIAAFVPGISGAIRSTFNQIITALGGSAVS